MNDQKWRSPTGHPIASHVTDKLPKINDVEAKTMTNDLKTVRDDVASLLLHPEQFLKRDAILAYLDRMIETPAPQAEDNPTSSEWFFRWIARGKAGYAGMTMERCADMIWHHPDNPYKNDNPWADNDAPTPAPTEKLDVDKLRYEVLKNCKLVAYEIDGANKAIDYLANTGRLR